MTSINSAIDRLFAGEIDLVSDRDLYPEDLSGDVPEPVKPHVSRTLANYALYSDTFRHTVHGRFWRHYKNNTGFAPWANEQEPWHPDDTTRIDELLRQYSVREDQDFLSLRLPPRIVDFSQHGRLQDPSDSLGSLGPYLGAYLLAGQRDIPSTRYQEQLLHLREGDIVTFSDARFVLGPFLGAGNATHIYGIHGAQDYVLRIPHVVPVVFGHEFMSGADFSHFSRCLLRLHAGHRPERDDIRVARLKVGSNGEYGLSERVYGQENGREFILRMQLMVSNGPLSGWRLDQALHLMEGHEEDLEKYRRLMNAVGYERMHKQIQASPEFMARQYLYDERTKEWVQVDWDDDNDRELPSVLPAP